MTREGEPMTVADDLREYAANLESEDRHWTEQIESLEARIVDARRKRDDLRFRRAANLAAAAFLEASGFAVEKDDAGNVTVRHGRDEA